MIYFRDDFPFPVSFPLRYLAHTWKGNLSYDEEKFEGPVGKINSGAVNQAGARRSRHHQHPAISIQPSVKFHVEPEIQAGPDLPFSRQRENPMLVASSSDNLDHRSAKECGSTRIASLP